MPVAQRTAWFLIGASVTPCDQGESGGEVVMEMRDRLDVVARAVNLAVDEELRRRPHSFAARR